MPIAITNRAKLSNVLSSIRQKIAGYNSTQKNQMNEATTIRLLIEPALDALGWDTSDPSEVCREYRTSGNGKVDLALLIDDKPVLYIEAKALKVSTDDVKWVTQTLRYAIADGVEWCVLTNGANYRIFKSHASVNLEEKTFGTVKISDQDDNTPIDSIAASLSLLSPQSMKSKDLNALWVMHEIDRKLEADIKGIIEKPEFHKWLSSKICKDLKPQQIGQSLRRANFSISYRDGHEYVGELDEERPLASPARRGKSPQTDEPGTSIKPKKMRIPEMIEKGLLQIGTVLTIKNRPGSEARVVDGRHVDYQGTLMTYNKWGERITGWPSIQIYMHAVMQDGRLLDDLRK